MTGPCLRERRKTEHQEGEGEDQKISESRDRQADGREQPDGARDLPHERAHSGQLSGWVIVTAHPCGTDPREAAARNQSELGSTRLLPRNDMARLARSRSLAQARKKAEDAGVDTLRIHYRHHVALAFQYRALRAVNRGRNVVCHTRLRARVVRPRHH